MDVKIPIEEFNTALWKRFHNGKIRNVYPLTKYNDIIEKIKTMEQNPPCNTPGEYYLLRKFVVVLINGKERLSCKPENNILTENIRQSAAATKFYVALEEIYTYLDEAHKWVKHGNRDRLVRKLQGQGIVNITRETVELFLSFCKFCRPKCRKTTKDILKIDISSNVQSDSPLSDIHSDTDAPSFAYNPTTTNNNINPNGAPHAICTFIRGFVDLIDLSHAPDGENRFVLLYMDVQTCFSVLYPVRCKCIYEVASHLLSIFTLLGPPQVLHSNLECNFLCNIIDNLKQSLPDLVLVSGSSTYSEVQEVARNCLSEVTRLLKEWMYQNSSNNWSHGLKLVQLKKNAATSRNGLKSPYECFFGKSLETNFNVDVSLLRKAEKEEDLLRIINTSCEESPPYEQLQVSLDPKICSLVQNNVHFNENHCTTPVIKPEPLSDTDVHEKDGYQFSDSSSDICSSPNGKLEIVIKQEDPDAS